MSKCAYFIGYGYLYHSLENSPIIEPIGAFFIFIVNMKSSIKHFFVLNVLQELTPKGARPFFCKKTLKTAIL